MAGSRFTPTQLVVGVLLVLAVGGAFFVAQSRQARSAARVRLLAATAAVPLGVQAPEVQLWKRDGTAVPLSRYRGKLVFVNFWATWCGPCLQEMPSLITLQRAFDPADVAFVSIAEDDAWPPLDAYLRANPLPFDVYRDQPPRVEEQFQTTAYPTSFLLDREGQALYRFNGSREWNTAAMRELLVLEGARLVEPAR